MFCEKIACKSRTRSYRINQDDELLDNNLKLKTDLIIENNLYGTLCT